MRDCSNKAGNPTYIFFQQSPSQIEMEIRELRWYGCRTSETRRRGGNAASRETCETAAPDRQIALNLHSRRVENIDAVAQPLSRKY